MRERERREEVQREVAERGEKEMETAEMVVVRRDTLATHGQEEDRVYQVATDHRK